jgi:hypothetical protein
MAGLYEVEVEPEVSVCLDSLSDRDFGRVDFLVGVLAERAETLGEPYTRHLDGKVRELRFRLLRQRTRVTYWAGTASPTGLAHRVRQDPQRRDNRSGTRRSGAEDLRSRARHRARHLPSRGRLT